MKPLVTGVGLVAIGIIGFMALDSSVEYHLTGRVQPRFFMGNETRPPQTHLSEVIRVPLLFCAMLAGVISGVLYKHFRNLEKKNAPLFQEVKLALSGYGLMLAILVSPIVFAVVYVMCKNQPDLMISALCSFENGFFWDTVLQTRVAGVTVAAQPATSR